MLEYWEIAIAVELENPHFRYMNRYDGSGDYSTSTILSNVSIETDAGETNLSNIFDTSKFTDTISIKNSEGQVVNKTVESINEGTSTITLASALASDFNESSLTLFGYGSNIAGGWRCPSSGGVQCVLGDSDNFGQKFLTTSTMKQTINSDFDYSSKNIDYRIFGVGKDDVYVNVTGASSSSYHLDISSAEYVSSGLTFNTDDIVLDSEIQIGHYIASISDVGLEFTYNPIIDEEISSNGYYKFPTYPDDNSVSWTLRDTSVFDYRNNQSVYQFDPTGLGERNEKITLTASFTKVPLSFYESLRQFERVQRNGFYLNLHPYGYEEIPEILTGKIKLSNKSVRRSMWDVDKVDFDLEFLQK